MQRVLIVDDSPEIRRLLRMVLEMEGYKVEEAANGVEALNMKSSPADVMLLDVMMPMADGYTVLAKLRERGGDKMPRIVMLTARRGERDRQQSLGRGAVGFITKPFDPDDVVKEVDRVLKLTKDELTQRREDEMYLSRLLQQLEELPLEMRTPSPGT